MHPDDPSAQELTKGDPATRPADSASTERTNGRHRVPELPRRGRTLLASMPMRIALATGVSCCLGLATYAGTRVEVNDRSEPSAEAVAERAALADERASRSLERTAPTTPVSPTPTASPTPTPTATAKKAPKKPAKPRRPRPVAGLTQAQMDNAKIIVDVGRKLDVPKRGLIIAVATAMQESNLYNYASGVLPESQNYPHQAIGWDHDSVGLFQQRPSSGWGTVRELMRPALAAEAFYLALLKVPGWQDMALTYAAQSVQVSGFPDAYAQHEQRATTVVNALT
ncbi:hypothetical protein D7147_26595 [Micromonospora musae]|uniref:Peptidase M23 n=1 Tax=Micromonospora musae TaxID=1894970 RepID=A0A3A9Y1Q3_9ACTN|nr:hypothetical protein [Micromonospora musae]RKN15402.1 hypothetical protein D7147_26595 [Micromonospora musae]RKN25457.1 hypothetical protein D7044_31590 [Micromonospora musae]